MGAVLVSDRVLGHGSAIDCDVAEGELPPIRVVDREDVEDFGSIGTTSPGEIVTL